MSEVFAAIRFCSSIKCLLGIVRCAFVHCGVVDNVVAGIECVDRGKLSLQYTGEPRRIGEQSRDDITNVDSLDMCRRCRRGNVNER